MDNKIKIGLFVDSFYPMVDGVIEVVDKYATYLNETCEVIVFTVGSRKKDNREYPYKVVKSKVFPLPFLDYDLPIPRLSRNFKKELKKSNLDIVHIHSPFAIGKSGIKYAKKHNIPVIATMHSQFKKDFLHVTKCKWLSNILLKKVMKVFNSCDRCFAVNENIAKLYYKEYGANFLPDVLPNGTELELVQDFNLAASTIYEKYGIDKDIPVLLFVGRLTNLKNIFFLARSLKELKNLGTNFKMIFVGTGNDEDKLKSLLQDLGIFQDVIFTGRITDRTYLSYIFRRATLFLFPSLYDANSLVQIEAASQKTPTVFVEGSATSSTVTNNVNGYIAPHSIEGYANTIFNILNNPDTLQKVSEAAYSDLFRSWSEIVKNVEYLYTEIINNNKSLQNMSYQNSKQNNLKKA
ncbi:MAG: glycosyltransferase [Clostridia bacterium]|nr:glycosyltransferase [Clostridia bacterium]